MIFSDICLICDSQFSQVRFSSFLCFVFSYFTPDKFYFFFYLTSFFWILLSLSRSSHNNVFFVYFIPRTYIYCTPPMISMIFFFSLSGFLWIILDLLFLPELYFSLFETVSTLVYVIFVLHLLTSLYDTDECFCSTLRFISLAFRITLRNIGVSLASARHSE